MNLFLKKTPSKRVGKDKNFIRYLTNFLKFFFKQKTAYEISACLVGSEMCIRDSYNEEFDPGSG